MAKVRSNAVGAVPVQAVVAAAGPSPLAAVAGPTAATRPPVRAARLPEPVYRRRRVAVAAVAAAVSTLVLIVGRPDRVPPGEANPWPSVGEVSLSAEPGVHVVQPGDTLWDIARAVSPGSDPRARVHELAKSAGGAALEPGQRVVIDPAAVSESAGASGRRVVIDPAAVSESAGASGRRVGQGAVPERADSET